MSGDEGWSESEEKTWPEPEVDLVSLAVNIYVFYNIVQSSLKRFN